MNTGFIELRIEGILAANLGLRKTAELHLTTELYQAIKEEHIPVRLISNFFAD
jgi:hypothetical protein